MKRPSGPKRSRKWPRRPGLGLKRYRTIGHYDIATIVDAADDATLTALLLNVGKLGDVRTPTLRAFSASEMQAFSDALEADNR